MRLPAGAFYIDLATEHDGTGLTTPVLINTFPYDGETGVPAADSLGAHPIHLSVTDIGSDGLEALTTVTACVGFRQTYTSPPAYAPQPTVTTENNTISVIVEDDLVLAETVHMGIQLEVFDGSAFDPDWNANSSYTTAGSGPVEHRLVLIRETAFASFQHIILDVYAKTKAPSASELNASYQFTVEDLTKPELMAVATRTLKKLRVTFSEAMEQGTGTTRDVLSVRNAGAGISVIPSDGSSASQMTSSRDAFVSTDVGKYVGIAGAANALNNNIFEITAYDSDTGAISIDVPDIGEAVGIIEEVLPSDATVTVSPYRVAGVPDTQLRVPYFNPIVTDAELISSSVVELTLHAEITPSREYTFYAGSVGDLNENILDDVTLSFTTEALDIPQARLDAEFNFQGLIPYGNQAPEEDPTGDLERFLRCLDEVLQLLLYDIDTFTDILDIDIIDASNLNALLFHLGAPFSFVDSLSEAEKRRLADILVQSYKRKGVETSMESLIAYVLGITVNVQPYYDPTSYWIMGLSALGTTAILGPGSEFLKYAFEVITPDLLTETERRRLTEMVEWMKPAHTHFVRLVEPSADNSAADTITTDDGLLVLKQYVVGAGIVSEPILDADNITISDQIYVILI
jgi:phage tail-like protein